VLVGEAVAVFASAGLHNREGVVLILGAANYQQHRSRLVEDGHDVEQLQMSGRLVCLVAAVPHDFGPFGSPAFDARDAAKTEAQAKALEDGLPSARVVRLPHASRNVYISNEVDVLREINAFIASLDK
jgi:hypothetical protein